MDPRNGAPLIEELLTRGRAAWPQLPLAPATLERHLARVDPVPVQETLLAHAADLCLAAACAEGVPQAIALLELGPLREIGDFVARIDSTPAFAADVQQAVREKLLVARGEGRPGKIADYSGRGPLGGWIRVVAVRTALDLRRAQGPEPVETDTDRLAAIVLDPETELLRERHREPFQSALAGALEALSARERNLLRLHFAEGWTLEQLATSYHVHRATVARWLAAAREAVVTQVAQRLGEAQGLTADELGSVVRLLGSQIHLSLSRLR